MTVSKVSQAAPKPRKTAASKPKARAPKRAVKSVQPVEDMDPRGLLALMALVVMIPVAMALTTMPARQNTPQVRPASMPAAVRTVPVQAGLPTCQELLERGMAPVDCQ